MLGGWRTKLAGVGAAAVAVAMVRAQTGVVGGRGLCAAAWPGLLPATAAAQRQHPYPQAGPDQFSAVATARLKQVLGSR